MDNIERAEHALQRVLVDIDWASQGAAAAASHRIVFGRGAPVSDVILGIDRPSQLFLLLANLAREAEGARHPDPARAINRANWDLMLGNFEMDEDSGAVRFRCGVHFGDDELPESAIRRTIATAMGLIEAHAAAIAEDAFA